MDELSCRCATFRPITNVLDSDNDGVSYVARPGVYFSRMLSPIGRNTLFCCVRYGVLLKTLHLLIKILFLAMFDMLSLLTLLLRPRERLRSIAMSMSVCGSLSVCLSATISLEPHTRSLPSFLFMLPVSVARSSSNMFTIGRIAYRREGVFFPLKCIIGRERGWECTARAKYAIYDCLVHIARRLLELI